jgi:hypothetical protein
MMLARWTVHARFGYKQDVVALLQRWMKEIGPQAGFDPARTRLLTGSIGAVEATVQSEHIVEDLAELQRVWDKLGTLDAHKQWGKELEPFVVSGSSRWDVMRLI